ncbi:MAG TPA: DUF4143 domain-containing protein [Desulfocapsa sulfexigens]|nr:DUF4143 domain-containing protein [Desulfocapsa sulfexigens]
MYFTKYKDKHVQNSLLRPYSSNISKRFVITPKLFMTDSGLFSHLLDVRNSEQLISSPRKGDIVETFVYSELLKHIDYSCKQPQIYHGKGGYNFCHRDQIITKCEK